MNANMSFQSIDDLNLDPIKRKLMHVASGEGWSRDKTEAVEKEYRRYLCVKKAYPDQLVAPTVDVDTFWHYHILDTAKYAADCERGLGYFLHHYPYLGMDDNDADDASLRLESGDRMGMLYEMLFGDAYPGSLAEASGPALSWCGGPWPAPANATAAGSALSYCGGPWPAPASTKAAGSALSYCGGPWPAPATARTVDGSALSYCGGPWPAPATGKAEAGSTPAWCVGPPTSELSGTAQPAGDVAVAC
jgi:hypothetical protein